MAGTSQNCSPQHPCPVCGKTDWCNYVTFPNGNTLAYCQRVHGNKGDLTSAGGNTYRCSKVTDAGFTVWEPLAQYNANLAAFKQQNPSGGNARMRNKGTYVSSERNDVPVTTEGVAEILPPEILDKFYRTLLQILKLENKHEYKLRQEWDQAEGMYDSIMRTIPIKSLPPEDRLRFSSKERLNNLSRKKIMEQLIEKCGEPKGVPGFYQRRDGVWTMHPLCGILFPVFDTSGNIIRLRIGLDYPQVKGSLNGKEGRYSYMLVDETAGWYFFEDGSKTPILAWQYGAENNLITLNKKGYPDGKVSGKYMNFTSCKLLEAKDENGNIVKKVNKFTNGCESGSFCSVYTKPGDDLGIVYVTEGEKKAIVANQVMNVPVISVPGVNSTSKLFEKEPGSDMSIMDSLRAKGTQGVVLAFDADKAVNEAVMHHEQRAVAQFKERNIHIFLGEWNAQWGKGLDDVLLTGVMPTVHFVK